MTIDWESELERALPAGPDRPVAAYVAPGRRALRRRRLGAGVVAAAALVAVLGGGAALVGASDPGGGDRGASPDVARDPSVVPTPTPTPSLGTGEDADGDPRAQPASCDRIDYLGEPAMYDDAGRLCLAPGVERLDRVADPMEYGRDDYRSVALEVTYEGRREFLLATWDATGSSITSRRATGSLADWLPGAVATQRSLDAENGVPVTGDAPAPDDWVRVDADDRLVAAADGVRVVAQQPADLGRSFAAPGELSVVAELRVDGDRSFVAVRRVGGTVGDLQVLPGGGGFADLDAFVADARAAYASGGGLL